MVNPALPTTKLDRDTFLVNQKHRAWMKTKYYVFDESGAPLFYVERPVKPLRKADIVIYDDDTKSTAPIATATRPPEPARIRR